MCILLLSYDNHPKYRMVLATNRDEYYDRPTKPLAVWDDSPNILAGRDLKSLGTWLGLSRTGRFAAVTNFREETPSNKNAFSRGLLVSNYHNGSESPESYLEQIKTNGYRYNGFNLLLGDVTRLFYYSNREHRIHMITPGLYGLSNHLLDTPWPKVVKGKRDLGALLAREGEIDPEDIFRILADRSYPPDEQLPNTGVDLDWERVLSSIFVTSDIYGTRSSSIIFMERSGRVTFWERTFDSGASGSVEYKTRKHRFMLPG